ARCTLAGRVADTPLLTRDRKWSGNAVQTLQDERLRLAITSARIGTWDFDALTGKLRWDPRCKTLFGLSNDMEPDYGVFLAALHPSDRGRVEARVREALRRPGDGFYEDEYRTVGLSDGVERWLAAHGRAFFDQNGRAVRFIGTMLDVTEKKRAQQTTAFLARASELLASSLDCVDTLGRTARLAVPLLGDVCIIELFEPDGTFRCVGFACADPALAVPATRLNAVSFGTMTGGRSILTESVDDLWVQAAAPDPAHLEALRTLGVRAVMSAPLVARGRTLGALTFLGIALGRRFSREDLGTSEDLARRAALAVDNARLFRDAQRAIQARDEFLSVASHELKTPLTPLGLKLDSLARVLKAGNLETLHDRLPGDVDLMRRQVKRLSNLVEVLLDGSRISSGRLHLQPEPVDLGALLRDVVARAEPEAERAGCPVELLVAEPVSGHWDRLRLEQVVENLLTNALKYGAGTPVTVSAAIDTSRARIEVTDHGIGIPAEAMQRIFDRFERAVSERHYGGLGLGLYVARQIVAAMNGTISVESRPGQGAAFKVELPLGPVPAPDYGQPTYAK
ncbi:MAG: ATP-binding protein, partial [Myxococcaceae bacterium]